MKQNKTSEICCFWFVLENYIINYTKDEKGDKFEKTIKIFNNYNYNSFNLFYIIQKGKLLYSFNFESEH